MRNTFKIISGDKNYVAHNNIKKAFSYWVDGQAYAAYISVFNNGHRLDKKAELIAYNDNIAKGELCATYRITVSENEFPYGITSIGFAPSPGAELSNLCSVNVPPSSAVIYGTIYLDVSGNFNFYPGENPLVRSLIGMTACGKISVTGSDKMIDNFVAEINTAGYSPVSSETLSDNGLVVQFDSGGKSDFILWMDSKPCARFDLAYSNKKPSMSTAACNGGFFVPGAATVSDVNVSGQDVSFGAYQDVTELHDTGISIDGFDGYELFGDPLHKYVGLKNGSTYYLIDGETFSVVSKGNYDGELSLCSDGSVVCVNKGNISLLNKGITQLIMHGDTVVFSRGGGYDIFVYNSNSLYFYRYEDEYGEIRLTRILTVVPTGSLYRINDYAVMIRALEFKNVYTFDGESSLTFFTGMIGEEKIKDGCYYGDGYMGNVLSYSRIECDKSFNGFCVSKGSLYYVGPNGLWNLGQKGNVDSAALFGDTVALIEGGRLKFYKASSDGIYVSTPAVGQANCLALSPSPKNATVKLKFETKEVL